MDVTIKASDKQAREAFIKARDDKQASQDRRAEKREDRRNSRQNTVTKRRLRRRIGKEVRSHLLTEKRNYLRGEPTGNEYAINTRIRYKKDNWSYTRAFVEKILNEALAEHTGFEYKVDFMTYSNNREEWCTRINITYMLLEQ